jgi:DNA-binding HxlR family transcriptional regulator
MGVGRRLELFGPEPGLPGEDRERMSSSVLSTRLAELTGAGLLALHSDGYHLTPLGQDLVEALRPLDAGSRRWATETDDAAAED